LEQEWNRGGVDENIRWLTAIDQSGIESEAVDKIKRAYLKLSGKGFHPLPRE
jgi:hypothetical protein